MKLIFYCDSGANAHSCKTEVIDLADFGLTEDSWAALPDEERDKYVKEWLRGCLTFGYYEE